MGHSRSVAERTRSAKGRTGTESEGDTAARPSPTLRGLGAPSSPSTSSSTPVALNREKAGPAAGPGSASSTARRVRHSLPGGQATRCSPADQCVASGISPDHYASYSGFRRILPYVVENDTGGLCGPGGLGDGDR